ncbi:MAG: ribonuclease III [Dehalococcoidales bacterium]|nr:ribonuclease III [Dehalococcoidales bacterium]
MHNLIDLQKTLKISFNDQSLLEQSMVHSSYSNENPDFTPIPNERLEFLGDAVLDLIIAEILYQKFFHFTEGEMTKIRAALVRRDTLARIAKNISLGKYLYLGKGEKSSGGRIKPANLAGAFEAMIAAVFLDQGFLAAKALILRLFREELHKIIESGARTDYKSKLQELLQAKGQPIPDYQIVEITGPDHDRIFTIEVRTGKTVLGTGSGKSKKMAEAEAARMALSQLSADFTQ